MREKKGTNRHGSGFFVYRIAKITIDTRKCGGVSPDVNIYFWSEGRGRSRVQLGYVSAPVWQLSSIIIHLLGRGAREPGLRLVKREEEQKGLLPTSRRTVLFTVIESSSRGGCDCGIDGAFESCNLKQENPMKWVGKKREKKGKDHCVRAILEQWTFACPFSCFCEWRIACIFS